MNRRAIVFLDGGGRFGNQLLNFAHLIAWVEENNRSLYLIDLAFFPYSHLCQGTASNLFCKYPVSPNGSRWEFTVRNPIAPDRGYTWHRISRVFRSVIRKLDPSRVVESHFSAEPNLTDELVNQFVPSKRVMFLHGYGPRNWELLEKHQDVVRSFLSPNMSLIPESRDHIRRLKQEDSLLIGVHIRQDDYSKWRNGRYFFSLEEYRDVMIQLQDVFAPKKVRFHLASTGISNKSLFADLDVSYTCSLAMGTHFVGDMYELSQCDLIAGPPSTFSSWAAFLGRVPLFPIVSSGQRVNLEDVFHDHLFDARRHEHFSDAVH